MIGDRQNRSSACWLAASPSATPAAVAFARRKLKRTIDPDRILEGVSALEALLPGPPPFEPNLEAMKASDWVGAAKQTEPWTRRHLHALV